MLSLCCDRLNVYQMETRFPVLRVQGNDHTAAEAVPAAAANDHTVAAEGATTITPFGPYSEVAAARDGTV